MLSTTDRTEDNLRSVHLAGRFVFSQVLKLGRITRVDLEQMAFERTPKAIELQLWDDVAGRVLDADADPELVAAWHKRKPGAVSDYVVDILAGSTAASIFSGGNGRPSKDDEGRLCKLARLAVTEEEIGPFLVARAAGVCIACTGLLKDPILGVAERLRSRRQMDAAACADLWQEIDPARSLALQAGWIGQ